CVIMVAAPILLMAQGSVEGDPFVDIGISVPNSVSVTDPRGRVRVTAVLVRIGKGVVGIEHSYAIHKDTDLSQRIEATFGLRHRVTREPKNEMLISRQIGKRKAALRIQIPGTHDVAA